MKVFSTYGDVSASMRKLSWTHFVAVLAWDDADEWLAEANGNGWSVATMKRMREIRFRMDNGEDLTTDSADDNVSADDDAVAIPTKRSIKRQPVDRQDEIDKPSHEPTTSKPATTPPQKHQTSNRPALQTAIDSIAALVTALKPQLGGDAGHRLAAQLRRWADEMDPQSAGKPRQRPRRRLIDRELSNQRATDTSPGSSW